MITSTSNPRIIKLRHLNQNARARRDADLVLLEGPHVLFAAIDAQFKPVEVYYNSSLLERSPDGQRLWRTISRLLPESSRFEVSESVCSAISDTHTSQGIIALVTLSELTGERVAKKRVAAQRPVLLILDNISDPGNLGTIIRTACAANAAAILLTPRCVDAWNLKVIRAAAGAHFLIPLYTGLTWENIREHVVSHCGDDLRVLVADADSQHWYYEENLTQPLALIIGNEAHGPSAEARAFATSTISIPLANHVESLNAAMAAGIVLYEAARQQAQA